MCVQASVSDALGQASGYKGGEQYQDAVTAVLRKLSSADHVAWAPDFGAALVTTQVHGPHQQSIIHAICLDNWSEETHRHAPVQRHLPSKSAARSTWWCRGRCE